MPVLSHNRNQSDRVQDVLVTNLRDTSVTISWQTAQPGDGVVEILQNGVSVALIADARGAGVIDRFHYAVASNLTPGASYQFTLHSTGDGSRIYPGQGRFSTFATPASVPSSHSAYGRVLGLDGATPFAGALVELRLRDGER